jgi:hypothetical protein
LGRLEAQLRSARLAVQLGLRLSRPAWAGAGWVHHGLARLGSYAGRLSSSMGWTFFLLLLAGLPPSPSPPRGPAASVSVFADRVAPLVGLYGIRCGGSESGAVKECVCVLVAPRACAGVSARRVLGRMPQRHGRDAIAMSRSRRGGGRARRGRGAGVARVDAAWSCGVGAHARARSLAAQGRGVAVPCAGHRHPGPAARHGGGRAMAVAGCKAARRAPARTDGTAARGKGGPTGFYRGFIGGPRLTPAAGEKKKGGGSSAHRRGWSRGCSGQR